MNFSEEERAKQWPALEYEMRPWRRDPDELQGVSKTRRRKITSTYRCALPLRIADRDVAIPPEMLVRMDEVGREVTRFDAEMEERDYDLPSLLLRSESASSSQIEQLSASSRNVALAELTDKGPNGARAIARNIQAMRRALDIDLVGDIGSSDILEMHAALMGFAPDEDAYREVQVWVGGTPYSPHEAEYIPPHHERVAACIDDLAHYLSREDVLPIVHAAVTHAQFETIHPFIDGNGRTGRALAQSLLRRDGLLENTALPVSAGLLHDLDGYFSALIAYRRGNPLAMVEQMTDALEVSVYIGRTVAIEIDELLTRWQHDLHPRTGSALSRLSALLVEQPVVSVAYVAEHLGVTERAALDAVKRACAAGVLEARDDRKRGTWYQATELLDILDAMGHMEQLQRMKPGRAVKTHDVAVVHPVGWNASLEGEHDDWETIG